ncbi:LOW QUALITY PROTEIN: DNA-binding protein RFX2-like [Amphiura filiformis]|uniref:LOW QUALITY PROTEIN: DNA-binding protein RFX2-like n=1 Tax=Amphiura filiformis TaxID=82378 RepID=UPI003B20DB0E
MATQTYEMQAITVSQSQQDQQQHTTSTTLQPQTIIAQPQQAHTLQPVQQFVQVATAQPSNALKDSSRPTTTLTLQTTGQGGPQTAVYQGHVQYVDGGDHTSTIYANGAMANNYPYSEGTTMYAQPTPISSTYYTSSAGQGLMTSSNLQTLGSVASVGSNLGTLVGGAGALIGGGTVIGSSQLVAQPGGTYVLQGHMMDGEGLPVTHTTRASPATVQWLLDNYETAEGVSLPRSTLYNHYLRHCNEHKLDPVNAASFGKLIRSVFLGLRTRRLGTRGNSKYHYYGIRIKSGSILNQYQDDGCHTAMRQQPINSAKRFKSNPVSGKMEAADGIGGGGQQGSGGEQQSQTQQHQQFLGDAAQALPAFDEIKIGDIPLPDGLTQNDVNEFESMYREHCESVLDVVVNLQFALIESLWQTFWRNQPDEDYRMNDNNLEEKLPKEKLILMCQCKDIQEYIKSYDHVLYQGLVEVLIPDVLRPIPSALTQAIRNFAKSLEGWLKNSMNGIPPAMMGIKIGAVTAFAQTLRRYTSLNHLAQAARAVLQNTSQINQMLSDLNRVDFANVQEQASWVCQCEDKVVQKLEQDFKRTLQQQNSLEEWASWLEGVVNQILKPHENSPNFAKAARQFLLKWSFYSSMVIRDLTLRSAASFGSFHLIRLLYDEYMFYLIEHRVASATGETPIAVMDKVDGRGERLMNSSASNANTLTLAASTNDKVDGRERDY